MEMAGNSDNLRKAVAAVTVVSFIIYLGAAFLLSVVAILSLYYGSLLTLQMVMSGANDRGIQEIFIVILRTITAVVLIETTIVFLRTKHLAVQTFLVAGLTEMIRHILIFDVGTMEPLHLVALGILMSVITAGIYLTGPRGTKNRDTRAVMWNEK